MHFFMTYYTKAQYSMTNYSKGCFTTIHKGVFFMRYYIKARFVTTCNNKVFFTIFDNMQYLHQDPRTEHVHLT